MGYTHYWYRNETLDNKKWKLACKDIIKLNKKLEPKIQFEYDDSKEAVANTYFIRFNGIGIDSHETFYIEKKHKTHTPQTDKKGRFFAFCKTAQKPYDQFVCCCLVILNHHFGDDFVVCSDGNLEDDYPNEWQKSMEICHLVLGYGKDFALKE